MRRAILLLLFSLGSVALHAQTRLSAGLFMGRQPYQNSDDTARVLSGVDALLEGKHFGGELAFEYADTSSGGALLVTHSDALFRFHTAENYSLRVGAGPTYVNLENGGSEVTWNGVAELARRTGRGEVVARLRQFDYELLGFRSRTSPAGVAVYLGYRFGIR